MTNVRFPHKAFARRLAEAETLGNAALGRWLYDPIKAKRLAARTTLRLRGERFPNDGEPTSRPPRR